jgi:hypothetical protein
LFEALEERPTNRKKSERLVELHAASNREPLVRKSLTVKSVMTEQCDVELRELAPGTPGGASPLT